MAEVSLRLRREIEKLQENPPSGISCYPKDTTLQKLDASIKGTPGSPYENGIFKIDIVVPEGYPFDPPRLRFITKVYHPNIDEGGRICLNLLKPQPEGSWRPTVIIEGLLVAVQHLLNQPNPDDPLVTEIAHEFRNNKSEYERKAREWTVKYALQ
ncbi:UNVERIFIED_CONTAM: hypothetical protein PYX00_000054 [Menopon gallinae]|uniref:Ubiquitin-conjugating enzyme E2 T n=1 Tax=Menopon gallinae TaxID=328185 RepID=A0AAW2I8Z4_9NEOP